MPKKKRKADAETFTKGMRARFTLGAKQREMKGQQGILPGWEAPPTPTGKPKEPQLKFKNIKRLGGFLTGEANRFLKNAGNAARKLSKKAKGGTVYRRSKDEVVTGRPRPETPQLKTKKGYRTGKVKPLGEAVTTRIDETSHKTDRSMTNMEYLYGHTYRDAPVKPAKKGGVYTEKMSDVEAFIKTNPIAVAHYMEGERLQKLKKKDPKRYQIEKGAVVGAAAGLVGWKAYKAGKRYYKEFKGFTKGL